MFYLKVVHSAWSKKHLRRWLVYSVAAFAWFGGISVAAGVTSHTAMVINGVCYTLIFFKSKGKSNVLMFFKNKGSDVVQGQGQEQCSDVLQEQGL